MTDAAERALAAVAEEAGRAALAAGADVWGVAAADPFEQTRATLVERKASGLHGGMHFTYGNPARSTTPALALAGARSLLVAARSYHRAAPPRPPGTGRVARYAWSDEYRELRVALDAAAAVLRRHGYRAIAVADDNALVDRAAARRAGIGVFGKNANILVAGAGSWFVLGSVVTDAPLPAPPPADLVDGCGSCTRCLPACPTGAIVAPGVVDARRCLAWLLQAKGAFPRQYRAALGDRVYGCDDCQEVCPANRVTVRHPRPARPDDDAWVPLAQIIASDDGDVVRRYGRWYIPGREGRYVRRNALVALGNVGDPGDPEVVAALQHALADPDPLIRAHAVWAAHALGLDDLLAPVADDPDGAVQEELACAGAAAP